MYISTSLVGMWMFGMCRLLMSHDREMEILAISSACLILSFENSPLPLSLTLMRNVTPPPSATNLDTRSSNPSSSKIDSSPEGTAPKTGSKLIRASKIEIQMSNGLVDWAIGGCGVWSVVGDDTFEDVEWESGGVRQWPAMMTRVWGGFGARYGHCTVVVLSDETQDLGNVGDCLSESD